jgi:myo-inositol-1(or 4)-monophosphatase
MNSEQLLKALEGLLPDLTDPVLGRHFKHTTATTKHDGSIVTEADQEMQQTIARALSELRPEALMLGEEMTAEEQQAVIDSEKPYWCLDPLDGTNNFHHGMPLFSVSLALIEQRRLEIALVYDPVRSELFSARQGGGLRIDGMPAKRPPQSLRLRDCLAFIDFKRLKQPLKERLIRRMPFKSQRNIGSCALEWAWLAAGRSQLLLHGGEKFWDYAAGVLLLQEAGGHSSAEDGAAIFNHSLDNRPCIAASTAALHEQWFDYLLTA